MDWKKLIEELLSSGMTQAQIGNEIGVAQPSIVDVLKGRTKDLRYSVGQRLVELHKTRMAEQAAARCQ